MDSKHHPLQFPRFMNLIFFITRHRYYYLKTNIELVCIGSKRHWYFAIKTNRLKFVQYHVRQYYVEQLSMMFIILTLITTLLEICLASLMAFFWYFPLMISNFLLMICDSSIRQSIRIHLVLLSLRLEGVEALKYRCVCRPPFGKDHGLYNARLLLYNTQKFRAFAFLLTRPSHQAMQAAKDCNG